MKKQSIDKARLIISEALAKSDIEDIDKVELMLNVDKTLKGYEENIEALRQYEKSKVLYKEYLGGYKR